MIKIAAFLLLVTAVVADNSTTITCVTSKDTNATCRVNVTQCHGPDNSIVDNAYTDYGCGPCDQQMLDTTVAGCAECTGADCNTYKDPTISFICYNLYPTKTEINCTGTAVHCHGPAKNYNGDNNVTRAGGCGPCPNATDTDCLTCDKAKCNSAFVMAPLLTVLLSLAFWLQ